MASKFEHIDLLHESVADGLVSTKKHPTEDLFIYNYTPQTQYSKAWNDATLAARGLILDGNSNVIARPFKKFFNYNEMPIAEKYFNKPPLCYEKLDGSLGIVYKIKDQYQVATRGSFVSDQALWATAHLNETYPDLDVPQGYTALVEIIYPENRIVVDYKGWAGLVLLGVIDTHTGNDTPLYLADWWTGERAAHRGLMHPDEAYKLATSSKLENEEGIVCVWFSPDAPAFRIKMKHPEYIRLHRIMTQISTKHVWLYNALGHLHERGMTDPKEVAKLLGEDFNKIYDILSQEQNPLDELLNNVPDEFYSWVGAIVEELDDNYAKVWEAAADDYINALEPFMSNNNIPAAVTEAKKDRGRFAEIARTSDVSNLVFGMLDQKEISPTIWKMIKPEYSVPFASVDWEIS